MKFASAIITDTNSSITLSEIITQFEIIEKAEPERVFSE